MGCGDTFELILQSHSFTVTVYSVFIPSRGQKLHNPRTLGERDGLLCIQQLGTSVVEVVDLDNRTKQADGRCLSSAYFFQCIFFLFLVT
jgi:low temperature requirement protein LtrA